MYDYHEDRDALNDLFRRCDVTNQIPKSLTNSHAGSSIGFHSEFINYLWSMEQYPESYCLQLVEPTDGQIIFVCVRNLKRVHFGDRIMTLLFSRSARVEPSRRRQHLLVNSYPQLEQLFQCMGIDFGQSYTLTTNIPSLTLQRMLVNFERREIELLDMFLLPTAVHVVTTQLRELTQAETERLWAVDLVDWVCRPVLSDLRRIMKMEEYKGTFIVGNFVSGQYSAASVWQSSNIILCDDRFDSKNAYRGPYWLVFNFLNLLL